jgi:hypothetical protein
MADDFTIGKFYDIAHENDFARLFQFQVTGKFGNVNFGNDHLVYIETASLPGRAINNIPVPYRGLSFNLPGTVSYPGSAGYQVTFRCDENYDIRAALEAATFNTFDEATSTGEYSLPSPENTLILNLIGKTATDIKRVYKLFGVYIQNIADTQYDVKDTGNIASVQCTLAYQFWRAGDAANIGRDTAVSSGLVS